MFLKLMILLNMSSGHALYLCGMKKYDHSTYKCVNKRILPRNMNLPANLLTCGDPPFVEKYDNRTHVCRNKKIIALDDANQRCGDEIYNPRFQTCCQSEYYKYKIHDGKPEKKYVCCNLEAYRRRSAKAVCHRSAHNDKFFKPKRIKANLKVCYTIVYMVRILQHGNASHRFMRASVSKWTWNTSRRKSMLRKYSREEKDMRIRLDEYSPKKNLTGKTFLIFSNHQYMKKNIIRLRFNENVYRLPRGLAKTLSRLPRHLAKTLSRIRNKCKSLKVRHRFKRLNG
ncbi:uncharacterized protein LOC123552099 [Mercenaria mercenaria]|uniref:uncharacterized protein LOC123552099 n=1 Tax=Mercenaria mercenaria TaxID=6596 RepID=UPI00234F1C16|nr:uncharacterized protein LOC123552099 [Mercenaria mercenaria]